MLHVLTTVVMVGGAWPTTIVPRKACHGPQKVEAHSTPLTRRSTGRRMCRETCIAGRRPTTLRAFCFGAS